MTKDRARKQAARQRAASTGERYVVAQRAVAEAEPQPSHDSWLHGATHQVPGVPAHVDGGLQARAERGRRNVNPVSSNPVASNRTRDQRQQGEPRVLVAWQNWIAKRLGADGR